MRRVFVNVAVLLVACFVLGTSTASAQLGAWKPGNLSNLRTVRVDVFACRAARYQVAFLQTFDRLFEAVSIPPGKRTAAITAAQGVADKACGNDPVGAHAAFGVLKQKMNELVDHYASSAAISRSSAILVLQQTELTLLADAYKCAGQQGNVSNFLGGGTLTGAINLVGVPVQGGVPGAIVPLGNIGTCGSGGGGGGGGTGNGALTFGGLDPSRFASCMSSPRSLGDCPYGDPDDDQAQDELDDIHEDDIKGSSVKMTTHADGSITITSSDGTSLTFVPKDNSTWGAWARVVADLFGAATASETTLTLIESGASGGAIGVAAASCVIALVALVRDSMDVVSRSAKPIEYVIVPGKLCPLVVGGEIAWWTDPAGEPIDGGDVLSVCTCKASLGTSAPTRCQSRAQSEVNRNVDCAIAPYATPGDAELCEQIITESNPDLERGAASKSICAYKDCGAFASGVYSALSDSCSCSSNGTGGGLDIDGPGWTDPLP